MSLLGIDDILRESIKPHLPLQKSYLKASCKHEEVDELLNNGYDLKNTDLH